MFWLGFCKKATEVTSAGDLEEPLMAGFHKEPVENMEGIPVEVLKGGANFDPDNDAIDASDARNPEHDNSHGRNDYPGGE